jgi:predicted ester cyclase
VNTEQVGREFVLMMNDPEKLLSHVTADAVADGGVLPQPMKLTDTVPIIKALTAAMPDLKYDIRQVTVKGNQATVNVQWTGTQTGTLSLPMPGLPAVPASGKKVSVKDSYVVTVQGDKVSHFTVQSPADGGIPAALSQLGIKLPPM